VVIVMLPTALAECGFVLESFFEHSRGDIGAALGRLIASPGIEINGVEIHLDALHRYQKTRVHFVDCLIAATSMAQDIPVATFDEDF
jgi:predicted nucleic-acid-binding protein